MSYNLIEKGENGGGRVNKRSTEISSVPWKKKSQNSIKKGEPWKRNWF